MYNIIKSKGEIIMLEKLDPVPRGRAEDLTGQKFRHLTVLYRVANRQERPTWQC